MKKVFEAILSRLKSLKLTELEKLTAKARILLKEAESTTDPAKRARKIKQINQVLNDAELLANRMSKKGDLVAFWVTVSSTLISVCSIILNSRYTSEAVAKISIDYYSAIVGLIPVLLIAMYFSDASKTQVIDSRLSAMTELLGRIIPAVAAIMFSLYAVAFSISNSLIFNITIYGLAMLTVSLVVKIVVPGFIEDRLKNHKLK